MTRLHELHEQQGQSPWIDNLKRGYLNDGTLAGLVHDGVRGVTSNPTIFEKAMSSGTDYDEQFAALARDHSVEDCYWEMVIADIVGACAVLQPVYDSSDGDDGFVSIEVSPALANDEAGTTAAARDLHKRIGLPNLMVKIPGTEPCLPAIQTMIAEGRNINVTLIFSVDRYAQVIEAYLRGLEERASSGVEDLSDVNSVASFFVSRVDSEVDARLDAVGRAEVEGLNGQAAVAQAKMAYQLFERQFSGPRWQSLADRGAKVQRPLWASTSTKNPAYFDLLYVDNLIGPDTVNTMPDATVKAFSDHGTVERTIDQNVEEASDMLDAIAGVGIDMGDVSATLERNGVASFVKSYEDLLANLADKHERLRSAAAQKGNDSSE